tara:strand:- start:357 stop:962 length:606 start_codon:yes stop_codon:yes gene_type:complete
MNQGIDLSILKYFLFLLSVVHIKGNGAIKADSQNLIFYNIEDTIVFKVKELMEINGVKYRYLGSTLNDNNIRTLQLGLIDGRNVEINVDDIFTFQKYKRLPTKSIRSGMIITSLINGLFGFALGYSEGTDNYEGPIPKGYDGLAGGVLSGSFFALFGGIVYGIPLGYFYGIISKEENELYYFYYHEPKDVYDYKLKFDYAY